MRKLSALALTLLLAACSGASTSPSAEEKPAPPIDSPEAHMEMCVQEHLGLFRFSRAYLEEFCPQLKSQLELVCMRFTHTTKDWHKACVGIDTPSKLECFAAIKNAHGYATLEALGKCKEVTNRRQVFCLSRLAARSGIPIPIERVQDCLDKNAD